jgi:hypothetical protein
MVACSPAGAPIDSVYADICGINGGPWGWGAMSAILVFVQSDGSSLIALYAGTPILPDKAQQSQLAHECRGGESRWDPYPVRPGMSLTLERFQGVPLQVGFRMRFALIPCAVSLTSVPTIVGARQDHHGSKAAAVTGFDQERTAHDFFLFSDGGAIDVSLNEEVDTKSSGAPTGIL